jgi:hypothetical protein
MPQVPWDLHYDRRVVPTFIEHFLPGGIAESLVRYARLAPFPLDLQMRKNPKTGAMHASLYVGLTSVLNVVRKGDNELALTAHRAWTDATFGFRAHWTKPRSLRRVRDEWPAVEAYIERVVPAATAKHASQEGTVQAAASAFSSMDRAMVDREAALHFRDQNTKSRIMSEVTERIVREVSRIEGIPGKYPTNFGGECDLLAIDEAGRLLAVEVKPRGTPTIRWAAAQATVYAMLFSRWISADPPRSSLSGADNTPDAPGEILRGMLQQRRDLGLCEKIRPDLSDHPEVVPVVAVQRGASSKYLADLVRVQDELLASGVGDPRLEIVEVDLAGRLTPLA